MKSTSWVLVLYLNVLHPPQDRPLSGQTSFYYPVLSPHYMRPLWQALHFKPLQAPQLKLAKLSFYNTSKTQVWNQYNLVSMIVLLCYQLTKTLGKPNNNVQIATEVAENQYPLQQRGKTFPLFQPFLQIVSGTNDTSFESPNIGRLEFAKNLAVASV